MSIPPLNAHREPPQERATSSVSTSDASTFESLEEREKQFQSIIDSDEHSKRDVINALVRRGQIRAARGNFRLAVKDWEAVLFLDKSNEDVRRFLNGNDGNGEEHPSPHSATIPTTPIHHNQSVRDGTVEGIPPVHPVATAAGSDVRPASPLAPAAPQPRSTQTMTNRKLLKLIQELNKQPLKNGDVWFIIPSLWFNGWKKMCEEKPTEIGTEYQRINTSTLLDDAGQLCEGHIQTGGNQFEPSWLRVPLAAWTHLSNWYGRDSAQLSRLVMPDFREKPYLDLHPWNFKLYFVLPPGQSPRGDYTPQVIVSRECSAQTLKSIILNSFPRPSLPHSVDFFSYPVYSPPTGWYVSAPVGKSPTFLEPHAWNPITTFLHFDYSIIVSVKMLDANKGCMVPVDPFPSPAFPPRILTWSDSCT